MKRFPALRRPQLWAILVLFVALIFLQYSEDLAWPATQRHALARLLFLAPIALAGLGFSLRAGVFAVLASAAAVTPAIVLYGPDRLDASLQAAAVLGAGALFNWWLEARRREAGQRDQTIIKLETIRRELLGHIDRIRDNERRLSLLHSIATAVNQLTTLDDILATSAARIREMKYLDAVLVYLRNERSGELELKAHQGISTESAARLGHLEAGDFYSRAAGTGEPCFVEDSLQDARVDRETARREGMGSQLVVPLKSGQKVVGALCAITRSVRQFSREERELLGLIGTELGVAVQKALLYEETVKSGKRFRELFTKAHDAIWVHDFEGKLVTGNRRALELIGGDAGDVIGEDAASFLTAQGVELAREVRRKLLAGEEIQQPYEQRLVRRDGSEVILMLTTSLLEEGETGPAFQNIARDVTRERRLQENLRLYVRQITQAHEEERKRIARELHDDSIQALIALSRRIDSLMSSNPDQVTVLARLEQVRQELDGVIDRTRRFMQDLRPPTLDYVGLVPALRELVSDLRAEARIDATLRLEGVEAKVPERDELLIYRIVQEALRNVWKHAAATTAEVVVRFSPQDIVVTVVDDGKGFAMAEDPGFVSAGKIGLAGMQERAALLGGKLTIDSRPGAGARVVLEVPRAAADAPSLP